MEMMISIGQNNNCTVHEQAAPEYPERPNFVPGWNDGTSCTYNIHTLGISEYSVMITNSDEND